MDAAPAVLAINAANATVLVMRDVIFTPLKRYPLRLRSPRRSLIAPYAHGFCGFPETFAARVEPLKADPNGGRPNQVPPHGPFMRNVRPPSP